MKRKQLLKDIRKESIFNELHFLLGSGLDFSQSFLLLIESERDDSIKKLLAELYDAVVRGESLGYAFEQSGRFTSLDCGVLRIGEETGRLDQALAFLAEYYGKRIAQRRIVYGAISYPLIILFTAIIVVVFMVLVIVPMFEQVYSRMGGELPAMTKWIISFSQAFPTYMIFCVLIVGGIGLLWKLWGHHDHVQKNVCSLLLRLPLIGGVLNKNLQARFCRLLHLLSSSGVSLLYGINMLSEIITFYSYRMSFVQIACDLEQGLCLSDAIGKFSGLYERRLITLLRVGEQTGRLPEMLKREADTLTQELEYRLRSLGNLLEPILILLVGVLVAMILIAMYLPMFRLGGIMG